MSTLAALLQQARADDEAYEEVRRRGAHQPARRRRAPALGAEDDDGSSIPAAAAAAAAAVTAAPVASSPPRGRAPAPPARRRLKKAQATTNKRLAEYDADEEEREERDEKQERISKAAAARRRKKMQAEAQDVDGDNEDQDVEESGHLTRDEEGDDEDAEDEEADIEQGAAEDALANALAGLEASCDKAKEEVEEGGITVERLEELRQIVPERFWGRTIDSSLAATLPSIGIVADEEDPTDANTQLRRILKDDNEVPEALKKDLIKLDEAKLGREFRALVSEYSVLNTEPINVRQRLEAEGLFKAGVPAAVRQKREKELMLAAERQNPEVLQQEMDDALRALSLLRLRALDTSGRNPHAITKKRDLVGLAIQAVARGSLGRAINKAQTTAKRTAKTAKAARKEKKEEKKAKAKAKAGGASPPRASPPRSSPARSSAARKTSAKKAATKAKKVAKKAKRAAQPRAKAPRGNEAVTDALVDAPENFGVVRQARQLAATVALTIVNGDGGLTPFQVSQLYHCLPARLVDRFLGFVESALSEYHEALRDAQTAGVATLNLTERKLREEEGVNNLTGEELKAVHVERVSEKERDKMEHNVEALKHLVGVQRRTLSEIELESRARDIQLAWRYIVEAVQKGEKKQDLDVLVDDLAYVSVGQMSPKRDLLPSATDSLETRKLLTDVPWDMVMSNTVVADALELTAAQKKRLEEYRTTLWETMVRDRYYPQWLQDAMAATKAELAKLRASAGMKQKQRAISPLVEALSTHYLDFWSHVKADLADSTDNVSETRARWLSDNFTHDPELAKLMLSPQDARFLVGEVQRVHESERYAKENYPHLLVNAVERDEQRLLDAIGESKQMIATGRTRLMRDPTGHMADEGEEVKTGPERKQLRQDMAELARLAERGIVFRQRVTALDKELVDEAKADALLAAEEAKAHAVATARTQLRPVRSGGGSDARPTTYDRPGSPVGGDGGHAPRLAPLFFHVRRVYAPRDAASSQPRIAGRHARSRTCFLRRQQQAMRDTFDAMAAESGRTREQVIDSVLAEQDAALRRGGSNNSQQNARPCGGGGNRIVGLGVGGARGTARPTFRVHPVRRAPHPAHSDAH